MIGYGFVGTGTTGSWAIAFGGGMKNRTAVNSCPVDYLSTRTQR
nr:hypothetical protein [Moorena producens]